VLLIYKRIVSCGAPGIETVASVRVFRHLIEMNEFNVPGGEMQPRIREEDKQAVNCQ
jgi:hypothetical protein